MGPGTRSGEARHRALVRDRALASLLRVPLASAVPYIAPGLRIASATALILAVTAESIIGSAGLGLSINVARKGGRRPDVRAHRALGVPVAVATVRTGDSARSTSRNPRDQVETKEPPDFAHLGAHVYTAIKRT